MIARTPALPATPLLRHAAEAHMFAEVRTLLHPDSNLEPGPEPNANPEPYP